MVQVRTELWNRTLAPLIPSLTRNARRRGTLSTHPLHPSLARNARRRGVYFHPTSHPLLTWNMRDSCSNTATSSPPSLEMRDGGDILPTTTPLLKPSPPHSKRERWPQQHGNKFPSLARNAKRRGYPVLLVSDGGCTRYARLDFILLFLFYWLHPQNYCRHQRWQRPQLQTSPTRNWWAPPPWNKRRRASCAHPLSLVSRAILFILSYSEGQNCSNVFFVYHWMLNNSMKPGPIELKFLM